MKVDNKSLLIDLFNRISKHASLGLICNIDRNRLLIKGNQPSKESRVMLNTIFDEGEFDMAKLIGWNNWTPLITSEVELAISHLIIGIKNGELLFSVELMRTLKSEGGLNDDGIRIDVELDVIK